MGFSAKNITVKEDSRKSTKNLSSSDTEDLLLGREEVKFLLSLIKDSDFKGKDIELVYNVTLKLQKVFNILNQ